MRREGVQGSRVSRKQFILPLFLKKKNQQQMMNAADFLSFGVIHTPQDTIKPQEEFFS